MRIASNLVIMQSPKKDSASIEDEATINVLKEKLFQWTCERHATNQPLNREIVADKVMDLSNKLGLRRFKFPKSWVTKFLTKRGFSPFLTSNYGPVFKDYREWVEIMRRYTARYRYKNLFQVDEMGMYHDISPHEIPLSLEDTLICKNGEDRERRVTVLLCCNASGLEKLPPLICGNFENHPIAPVDNYRCYSSQNAWLTADIFKAWLSQLNTEMSRLNRKILLLLNRSRVHAVKEVVLSNVSLMFFPKDFPSDLQPLKADIFHYVKIIYRRNYVKKMLQPGFSWTIKDAVSNIVNTWENVPKEFILSSFRRTNFRDDPPLKVFFPEWETLKPRVSFQTYVTFDDELSVGPSFTRRSKRLSKMATSPRGNNATCFTPESNRSWGRYEIIDLRDSDPEEDTTTVLFIKNTANNTTVKTPGQMISELKSEAGTGNIPSTDGPAVELDEVNEAPSSKGRKRHRELEAKQDEEANDDSRAPMEKRQTKERTWSDVYEHNFVFGAPRSPRESASDSHPHADVGTGVLHPAINSLEKNDNKMLMMMMTQGKKSVFTFSHPSV